MPFSQKRVAPRQRATLPHDIPVQLPSYGNDDTAALALRQADIDIVGLLAARARVAVPTARLYAELHGFGGARG